MTEKLSKQKMMHYSWRFIYSISDLTFDGNTKLVQQYVVTATPIINKFS